MRTEIRAGLIAGGAVAATFLAVGSLTFGWQWSSILLAVPIFSVFFGLFHRLEQRGEMMRPLWVGILGLAASSLYLFDWTEEVPRGRELIVDAAFVGIFAALAVHGIRAWLREERRGDPRSGV